MTSRSTPYTPPAVQTTFVEFHARQDRPRFLHGLYGELLAPPVLDVGCDRAALREIVGADRYTGIDRSSEADVRQDLQANPRLPFEDRAFETVFCTDVLEHLENLHALFDELVRVTRTHLLVTLPNNWNSARARLARGHGPIAHYGLPLDPPEDRHRWFFSLGEAELFLLDRARRHALEVVDLRALEKPRPAPIRLARRIASVSHERYLNRFAHTILVLYRRS